MGTETTNPPAPPPAGPDPYYYGWRMVPRWDDQHRQTWEKVPLTEWDVLHPEEGDFIVNNAAHDRDVHYLRGVFEEVVAGRPGLLLLTDHRVLWQVPGLGAHGPDVIVFDGVAAPWDPNRATFPVRDMGARPVVVVEVTSPSTKYVDTDNKVVEYFKAGVPLYVIADRREIDDRVFLSVYAYRATPDGFVRVPDGDPSGVRVEPLDLWIRSEGGRVICADAAGNRFPDRLELVSDKRAVEAERDTLKAQAADLASRNAELEAELRRLRGEANPNTPNTNS